MLLLRDVINMASLLTLPRFLRDKIYAECLTSDTLIDDSLEPLHLTTDLLVVCRQVYHDARDILYDGNTFHATITPLWHYSAPTVSKVASLASWRSSGYACVVCQRESATTGGPCMTCPLSWRPQCRRIRRLRITILPYSYLDWRYRVPDPGFAGLPDCRHHLHASLPPNMSLHSLTVHVGQRALFPVIDALEASGWYAVTSGYRARDGQNWRAAVVHDIERTLEAAQMYTDLVVGAEPWVARDIVHDGHIAYIDLRSLATRGASTNAALRRSIVCEAEVMGDQLVATYG